MFIKILYKIFIIGNEKSKTPNNAIKNKNKPINVMKLPMNLNHSKTISIWEIWYTTSIADKPKNA
jgi:hypothetical protein